jgi:hypothetical protein
MQDRPLLLNRRGGFAHIGNATAVSGSGGRRSQSFGAVPDHLSCKRLTPDPPNRRIAPP